MKIDKLRTVQLSEIMAESGRFHKCFYLSALCRNICRGMYTRQTDKQLGPILQKVLCTENCEAAYHGKMNGGCNLAVHKHRLKKFETVLLFRKPWKYQFHVFHDYFIY